MYGYIEGVQCPSIKHMTVRKAPVVASRQRMT